MRTTLLAREHLAQSIKGTCNIVLLQSSSWILWVIQIIFTLHYFYYPTSRSRRCSHGTRESGYWGELHVGLHIYMAIHHHTFTMTLRGGQAGVHDKHILNFTSQPEHSSGWGTTAPCGRFWVLDFIASSVWLKFSGVISWGIGPCWDKRVSCFLQGNWSLRVMYIVMKL